MDLGVSSSTSKLRVHSTSSIFRRGAKKWAQSDQKVVQYTLCRLNVHPVRALSNYNLTGYGILYHDGRCVPPIDRLKSSINH